MVALAELTESTITWRGAVFYPEDELYLIERDTFVDHFEVG